jgi:hypothetical protein
MPDAQSLHCLKSLTKGQNDHNSLELLENLQKAQHGSERDVDTLWQSLYTKIGLIVMWSILHSPMGFHGLLMESKWSPHGVHEDFVETQCEVCGVHGF